VFVGICGEEEKDERQTRKRKRKRKKKKRGGGGGGGGGGEVSDGKTKNSAMTKTSVEIEGERQLKSCAEDDCELHPKEERRKDMIARFEETVVVFGSSSTVCCVSALVLGLGLVLALHWLTIHESLFAITPNRRRDSDEKKTVLDCGISCSRKKLARSCD